MHIANGSIEQSKRWCEMNIQTIRYRSLNCCHLTLAHVAHPAQSDAEQCMCLSHHHQHQQQETNFINIILLYCLGQLLKSKKNSEFGSKKSSITILFFCVQIKREYKNWFQTDKWGFWCPLFESAIKLINRHRNFNGYYGTQVILFTLMAMQTQPIYHSCTLCAVHACQTYVFNINNEHRMYICRNIAFEGNNKRSI